MKYLSVFTLILCVLSQYSCKCDSVEKELNPSLVLWYDKPAENWTEALPVGNGRIGAMVYGGTEKEIIQFNEETLWSGQPHDYAHKGAYEVFPELRKLLWDGKQDAAHKLGNERFMSEPLGQLCYQPFGNLLLDFPGHENPMNFKRKLDLEDAVTSVSYDIDGITYNREVLVSEPNQAIVIQLETSGKGALEFSVGMDSPHEKYDVTVEGNVLVLKGKANNYPEDRVRQGAPYPESKLIFEARLRVLTDGELEVENNQLKVNNAKKATLELVAATSFVNYHDISGNPTELCKNYLQNLDGKPYDKIKKDHVTDYQSLFGRVDLDLGNSEISYRPTNERLKTFKKDEDPSMVSLLFQYGRYLLISSSRPGTQPANLQGIWNDKLAPSWDSKYTININTEMNYWPAEMTNLSELADPLTQMVQDLSVTGQNIAKEHYALKGWVTHHNTDIWRGAAPINHANHGIWPTGGAWLSQHLWWHYQFTGDKDYLKNRAYPVLKEASRFFAEYLVPDPTNQGWLVSGPSNSPENGGLVMAPTMDHQIIRNLFANTIEAANILGVDAGFAQMLGEKRAKIAPNQIGQYGQLQEWLEDKDDPKNEHRHVSHLWGLHPGNEIHPLTTPELAEACKVTLSHRGDGGTGWSRAWKINFWSRLLDGDHSFLLLKNLMVPSLSQETNMQDKGGLYFNLFDAHPPFQIDGNFGATSGITEMLLQSHLRDENGDFYIDILPALPSALASGKVSGLKARGGFEISITWEQGTLVLVEVKSLLGNKLNLRYAGSLVAQNTVEGETYSFGQESFQ
ncbi:glycoside hydrolase N-terminal domain-containing protein [Prolixibacteraceae bacterium Z1-6]|uniref:Glycoside hydrolase N-terminal domain-containing protein n=1 Tax=Draconibacterium aestuarii TaxID=2998507 RepID=A0A9X3F8C5_9BACT|nr:glycoside hydrolase N-terminal domain-containing protein [Prolixibacteraceae bacterium Z1-6]